MLRKRGHPGSHPRQSAQAEVSDLQRAGSWPGAQEEKSGQERVERWSVPLRDLSNLDHKPGRSGHAQQREETPEEGGGGGWRRRRCDPPAARSPLRRRLKRPMVDIDWLSPNVCLFVCVYVLVTALHCRAVHRIYFKNYKPVLTFSSHWVWNGWRIWLLSKNIVAMLLYLVTTIHLFRTMLLTSC